jgi:hypothetical protein
LSIKEDEMMVDEISNKTLAVLLIVAIAISLGGTLVSINRLSSVMRLPGGITGYASASSTGTTNVTITSSASIRFSRNNLDFGVGAVNSTGGNQLCSLASSSTGGSKDTNARCINFTAAGSMNSLQIENDGTNNLTVNLTSTQNAAGFVGGPAVIEQFRYTVTNNESNSCATPLPATWTAVTIVGSGQMAVCQSAGGLGFIGSANSLNLDFNLTIPYDSYKAGAVNQVVTITAIGTTLP